MKVHSSRRNKYIFPILTLLFTFAIVGPIAELAYRVAKFGFDRTAIFSFLKDDDDITPDLVHQAYPIELDKTYGWIPSQRFNNLPNIWKSKITVLEDSRRSNDQPTPKNDRCSILAVGDSFTFGDEVSDGESWPAYLEKELHCPVINAGVCAYGIDQAALRAKHFIELYKPKVLVFSIIMDDIFRTTQSIRQGLAKPYYTIENDKLLFHEVTESLARSTKEYAVRTEGPRPIRDFLSNSHLLDDFMYRLAPRFWRGLQNKYTGQHPEELSCRILQELDKFTQERNIQFFLVFQHLKGFQDCGEFEESQKIVACLKGTKISIFDTGPALKIVQDGDPKRYDGFFKAHMTAEGNKYTAKAIADHLRKSKIPL
jgi:hypothetical protein